MGADSEKTIPCNVLYFTVFWKHLQLREVLPEGGAQAVGEGREPVALRVHRRPGATDRNVLPVLELPVGVELVHVRAPQVRVPVPGPVNDPTFVSRGSSTSVPPGPFMYSRNIKDRIPTLGTTGQSRITSVIRPLMTFGR